MLWHRKTWAERGKLDQSLNTAKNFFYLAEMEKKMSITVLWKEIKRQIWSTWLTPLLNWRRCKQANINITLFQLFPLRMSLLAPCITCGLFESSSPKKWCILYDLQHTRVERNQGQTKGNITWLVLAYTFAEEKVTDDKTKNSISQHNIACHLNGLYPILFARFKLGSIFKCPLKPLLS